MRRNAVVEISPLTSQIEPKLSTFAGSCKQSCNQGVILKVMIDFLSLIFGRINRALLESRTKNEGL